MRWYSPLIHRIPLLFCLLGTIIFSTLSAEPASAQASFGRAAGNVGRGISREVRDEFGREMVSQTVQYAVDELSEANSNQNEQGSVYIHESGGDSAGNSFFLIGFLIVGVVFLGAAIRLIQYWRVILGFTLIVAVVVIGFKVGYRLVAFWTSRDDVADLAASSMNDSPVATIVGFDDILRVDLRFVEWKGLHLADEELTFLDLRNADLRNCNLSGANLSSSLFGKADLRGASFVGAVVQNTDFLGANLSGADLRAIDLSSARLRGANLEGVLSDDRTVWPVGISPE